MSKKQLKAHNTNPTIRKSKLSILDLPPLQIPDLDWDSDRLLFSSAGCRWNGSPMGAISIEM